MAEAWRGFKKDGHWDVDVNVRDFIQTNYTPYDGDESFLEGSTEATDKLWGRLQELQKEEREHNGVLECETEVVSSLTASTDDLRFLKSLKQSKIRIISIPLAIDFCTKYSTTSSA